MEVVVYYLFTYMYLMYDFSAATIRTPNPVLKKTLTEFGQYVAEMLPKYVQKVEVTSCEELDIMIHPEGIIPTMQFLKDHHNTQFLNIIDIAGMDVPTREYRFEVPHLPYSVFKIHSYR